MEAARSRPPRGFPDVELGSLIGRYLLRLLGLPAILGSFGKTRCGVVCGEDRRPRGVSEIGTRFVSHGGSRLQGSLERQGFGRVGAGSGGAVRVDAIGFDLTE